MKEKTIIVLTIIVIIIVTLFWLYLPEKKEQRSPPVDNTLYVQSNSPGECRAIITPIVDSVESISSEIPCKVQLR